MAKPRTPRMTAKEINLNAARDMFKSPPTDKYEIAEAAVLLKTRYRLTRLETANVLGIRSAEVLTAYRRYDEGAAKGIIPTGKMPQISDDPHEDVVEDEESRRERLLLGKTTRSTVAQEIFETTIAKAIGPHLPTKPYITALEKLYARTRVKPVRGKKTEVAMATISDLHLYLTTDHHDAKRGLGALDNFMRKVNLLTELHRQNFNVKTLVLNWLGDNVQGTANFPAQRWTTDRPAVDQAEGLTEAIVRVVTTSLLNFDDVVLNFQPGNHGFVTPRKTSTDPDQTNWEIVVARSVKWAFRNEKRVTINIPSDWYQIVDVMGNKFLLTHGHAMMGSGTFDGIVKTVNSWSAIVPPFSVAICGHFHRCAALPIPTPLGQVQRRIYINGTAVDHDDFLQKMGGSPTPQWWLFMVNEKRITSQHMVDLYD